MRLPGWSKLGYYPTPGRVTDLVAANFPELHLYRPVEGTINQARIMDPCCGEGIAVAQLADRLRCSPAFAPDEAGSAVHQIRTYGIELDRERSAAARRRLYQVWNADIDNTRILENSYNVLWLNPPYDWSDDEDHDQSRRLESRFLKQTTPGLTNRGVLIYIIPQHVLAWDARYLVRNYQDITVARFPDPEYEQYRQVVVMGRRRGSSHRPAPEEIAAIADLASVGSELSPLSVAPGQEPPRIVARDLPGFPSLPPVRVMRHNPEELVRHMRDGGAWDLRAMRDILSTDIDPVRLRPLETLLDGHAAMVAANSMMDNILIRDPQEQLNPIVIRGFFRKVRRETFRSPTTIKRTDFFESNIRALDAVTGEIEEVGDSPSQLQDFMTRHGPTILSHIATVYPPAVDLASPLAQRVAERIATVGRPLLGKQVGAAITGAAHLSRNQHLNLFATQGSGKTCTANAIARGLDARKVVVVTPARVVPNWIAEIKAMYPGAIIRVVQDHNPIGSRRPATPFELSLRPRQVGRASLEEIRRLDRWATPETPLWVIFKKDSCRSSYPVQQGLRFIGGPPEDTPFRPLERLIEAERRPRPARQKDRGTSPARRLYRSEDGQLSALDLAPEIQPMGTCPKCWYAVTDDETWTGRNRNSTCPNPRELPRFPGQSQNRRNPDDVTEIETVRCQEPIATAVRTDTGRAVFSYGDYASRYLNRWMDLLIVDEAQDYKAKDSAQGQTVRRLAQKAPRTLFLTGTPFGGKVSEVFFTLIASDSAFSRQFSHNDLTPFKRAYGREEVTIEIEDPGQSVGLRSNRRESRKPPKEIPGYHPALLEHFWHNTIFMSLEDVDTQNQLPGFTQIAQLLPLDDAPQPLNGKAETGNLSQKSAYAMLDDSMKKVLRQELKNGNRQMLGHYLHETLCYPENCWQGAAPTDSYGRVIINLPPLDAGRLYPKEQKLLEILSQQKAAGRKCLVYCTHTKRRDTTQRLSEVLSQHGFRALQLRSGTVNSEQRTAWLQQEANRNDLIITQPRLVETGVNLLEYPTIIWYEIEYSMFTTEQASARSYRINQTQPVEVHYLAYAGTMQERALRIIAQKADVSRTFHGDLSKNGLSAFNPDPDDIREQLARELLSGEDNTVARNGSRHDAAVVFTNHGDAAPAYPPPSATIHLRKRHEPSTFSYSNAGAVQTSLFDL